MTPKRIVKGTRVRLHGIKGWWKVVAIDGTGITCTRKISGTHGSTDSMWTDIAQVTNVSNIKLKGKSK